MTELKHFNIFLLLIATLNSYVHGTSITKVGDVIISINGDEWKCDQIYCPKDAAVCEVQKYTTNTLPNKLHRKNFCYSTNGTILEEKNTEESAAPFQRYQIHLKTNRFGNTISSLISGDGLTSSNTIQGDLSTTNVVLSDINMPSVVLPTIEIPRIILPIMPEFNMPRIQIPRIDIPEIRIPALTIGNDFMNGFMDHFMEDK